MMWHLIVNFATMLLSVTLLTYEQLMDARRTCLEVYKRNREPNIGELLGRNIRIREIVGAYDLI